MRADRLVSLVLLLRQHGRLSATTLARELEVSTRTVLRDVEALSTAGAPVYAERGRHGGFALLPGFSTELTGLSHDEALALLVSGSRRGAQALGLGSALASATSKVVDALPDSSRATATGAAQRLLIDPETDLLSRRLGTAGRPGGHRPGRSRRESRRGRPGATGADLSGSAARRVGAVAARRERGSPDPAMVAYHPARPRRRGRHLLRRVARGRARAAEPVREGGRADPRVIAGEQAIVTTVRAVVARVRDHDPGVVGYPEDASGEVIEA